MLRTYKEAKIQFWLDCVALAYHDMSFYGQDIVRILLNYNLIINCHNVALECQYIAL